ncbi:MAG: secondary thiamine-phosphate synthase enzyme YjbQ [Methylacidiphilales bacterium]|nr:secondary thiamine-phosphate synthase enzyme YjbQ [Candidatus Methylacidiphilales bacterium]
MISKTSSFSVRTKGKGTYEITDKIREAVSDSGVREGTATVFITHTSASLIIFENADPSARTDLHKYFEDLVPEDTPGFVHTLEGPDDMTSHIRMVLTRTSEVIPIAAGKLCLGTWQGVFVFEHRNQSHTRTIVFNVTGV